MGPNRYSDLITFLFRGLLATMFVLGGATAATAGMVINPVSLQAAMKAEQQASEALSNAEKVVIMVRDINDAEAVSVATEAVQIAEDALKKARNHRLNLEKVVYSENAVADPSFFTRPKTRLRINHVPDPMQAPKYTWLRYVKSDRASLILDALEEGMGNLDRSINYLDNQIIRHGSHRAASSALSYLEGLRMSYISAGAEYRKKSKGDGQAVTVESRALMQAILKGSEIDTEAGLIRLDREKPDNSARWRIERGYKVFTVLKATSGDLEKSYKMLRSDKDIIVAADAEYYLRGSYAYWDFLAEKGGKK